jgi:hypothetical protein
MKHKIFVITLLEEVTEEKNEEEKERKQRQHLLCINYISATYESF